MVNPFHGWTSPPTGTGPILKFCGMLSFALGVFNFMQNFAIAPKIGKNLFCDVFLRNSVLRSCFWLTESKVFFIFVFFCVWPNFFGGGIIYFGATAKDLGYTGLWDCSPFRTSPFICFGAQQAQIQDETLMIWDSLIPDP